MATCNTGVRVVIVDGSKHFFKMFDIQKKTWVTQLSL